MTMMPEELKRIRARMKMTQVQLAEALGVRQETVARWESGMRIRGIPEPTARLIRFIGLIAARVEAARVERAEAKRIGGGRIERGETKLFLQLWRASAGGKGKKKRHT